MVLSVKGIAKLLRILNEEFILYITIIENKLKFIIKNEGSIEHFERDFSFKELNEFKAFSLFDSLEEIFNSLNEKLNIEEKITLEHNSDKDVDLNFEFSYMSKKIPVQFTLEKKPDLNYLLHILDDFEKIKKENKELREINEGLINFKKIATLKSNIVFLK